MKTSNSGSPSLLSKCSCHRKEDYMSFIHLATKNYIYTIDIIVYGKPSLKTTSMSNPRHAGLTKPSKISAETL